MERERVDKQQELETSERLLDAAEKLFAEHGFDGVGMRALAEEAGVNLGAATYHYGSKENLYIETFMRRFRPANQARMEALRAAEAASVRRGKALSVTAIVDCMFRAPFMTVVSHPGFSAMLVRNLSLPPEFLREAMEKELVPAIEMFVRALKKALPKIEPEKLRLRVLFSAGAMLMAALQLSRLSGRLAENRAVVESVLGALVHFVAAGMRCAGEPLITPIPSMPFLAPRV